MKKYTATDEIVDHKGDLIKIEQSFSVDNAIINSRTPPPCYDTTAFPSGPTCNCNPRIGHTFKVTGVKINGIWFQSPNTWAQPPTNPGPFSPDPCPSNVYFWADWSPMLFSDYNNPLNPPTPWWNPQASGDPWHDFAWNTHPAFHHQFVGGSQVSNPWEDAFYNRVCQELNTSQLIVGQKFSAQFGVHPQAVMGTSPGMFAVYALMVGLADQAELTTAGVNFIGSNQDFITDFCFEYAGYQLAWTNWFGFWDSYSTSSCLNIDEEPKFCYEIGDITDPNDPFTIGGAGGMVFATPFTGLNQTPYYYEVALDDIATGAQPLDSLSFYQTSPYSANVNLANAEVTCGDDQSLPFSTVGAEWGAYAQQLTLSTSIDFNTGIDNTDNIYNQPALPTFPTHDTAANLCKNYILNGKKDWFLPSLMEFHLMFTNLGLNSSLASTLNLNTDILNLGEVYWTSSAVTGYIQNPADLPTAPPIGGPDTLISYPYAWAYNTHDPSTLYSSTLPSTTPSFGANVIPRCSSLSVRPIRRFECIEVELPSLTDTTYNFVDNAIMPQNYNQQALGGSDWPYHTGIFFPGCLGGGGGWLQTTNPSDPTQTTIISYDGTIGGDTYIPRIALTDTAGNQYDLSDFDDTNNPDGYIFKIWSADKTYLGTWHYQNCEIVDEDGLPAPAIQPHIFDNSIITGNPSVTWFNDKDFPGNVRAQFTNVTHLDGPHEIVCYGFYNSSLAATWGNYVLPTWISGPSGWVPPGYPSTTFWDVIDPSLGSTHIAGYNNEYKEGAYIGHSSSYAYILFSCQSQQNKTIPLPDIYTGNNTTYQSKKVVCLKSIFEQVKDIPGQQILHPTVGGFLGVGRANLTAFGSSPISNATYGSLISDSGDTLDRDYGDFYPKHYLFAWFADYDPDPISNLPIFNNFLDGFNSETCGGVVPCAYQVGDIGPAGGIIVAVPYMNVNDPGAGIVGPSVPPLQGTVTLKNPTKFYYEISPVNLNNTGEFEWVTSNCAPINFDSAQWGSSGIDVQSAYLNYWVPEDNHYDSSSFPNYTNEEVGEGQKATAEIIAASGGLPMCETDLSIGSSPDIDYNTAACNGNVYTLTAKNAFEMCDSYTLNGYDDWFLPTTREMEFARNYSPPGTLYDSSDGLAHFNGYGPGPAYNIQFHYWTCNTEAGDGNPDGYYSAQSANIFYPAPDMFGYYAAVPPNSPNVVPDYGFEQCGLSVSMEPISSTSGPDGHNWRTNSYKCYNNNVRAMRRFECGDIVTSSPTCPVVRFMGNNNILLWLDPADPASLSPLISTMPDRLSQLTAAGYQGIMESNIAIAKFGNKVWIHGIDSYQPGNPKVIIEWDLDITTLSLSLSNVYYETGSNLANSVIGAGMCAADATTLVMAGTYLGRVTLDSSNSTFTVVFAFALPGACQGDVVYLPQSDSTVTSVFSSSGVPHFWQHHGPSGNLLDQLSYPFNSYFVVSMFCHNGKIIAPVSAGNIMLEITTSALGALSVTTSSLDYKNAEDMASDPNCCNVGVTQEIQEQQRAQEQQRIQEQQRVQKLNDEENDKRTY